MSARMSDPRFQLCYWPIPFRGCFVSYLFAYRDVPFLEETGSEEISRLMSQHPTDQEIPFMGPPLLRDLESGRALSQMPAIVLYVSRELGLLPEDPFELTVQMKILMDCNDVLMEICRYNGSMMWMREDWTGFRSRRLPRWMQIFEACLEQGLFGRTRVTFADISVFALFGNMTRCLPDLEADFSDHAPGVHALCRRIAAQPSLAQYVADQERRYGKLYCGGQIEESIREMLQEDAG